MIHHLSVVGPDCRMGEGCEVWQFASVIRGAVLGEGVSIGSCAIIDGARIGDWSRIGHGAQLHPGFVGGNRVFIGPAAVICNDVWPRVDKEGFDLGLLNGAASVVAEDDVSIGAAAVILPGVRLGKASVVAASAVVVRSVPAGCLYRRDGGIEPLPPERRRMRFAA